MRRQRRKAGPGRKPPIELSGGVHRSRLEIDLLPVRLMRAYSRHDTAQITQVERELLALSKPDLVRAVAAAVTLWLWTIDPGSVEIVSDQEAS